MKIRTISKAALPKIPHDRCIVVRTTAATLIEWKNDADGGHRSLSRMLNERIMGAFQILFSAIKEEEGNEQ